MSANLFAFNKAVHLVVFVGVVTVGSWVASQTTSEATQGVSNDGAEPSNRDSTFVPAASDSNHPDSGSTVCPTQIISDASVAPCGASSQRCENEDQTSRSADVEFLTSASLDLSVAGIDTSVSGTCQSTDCSPRTYSDNCESMLGKAAKTGCRLFSQLAGIANDDESADNIELLNAETPDSSSASVITVSNEQTTPTDAEPALLNQTAVQPISESMHLIRAKSPANVASDDSFESCDATGPNCEYGATDCPSNSMPATTCHLKNRKTNESVATLSIASTNTETLTEEELAASQGGGSDLDASLLTPMVHVSQNEYTQAWKVEAKNIEMATLLQQLDEHCDFEILCGDDVTGTVSAEVSAHSMDEVLHRLVVPFGLSLRRDGATMIVGLIAQPRLAAPTLALNTRGVVNDGDLNRLPPVQEPSKIEPASLVRRAAPVNIGEDEKRIAAQAKQSIAQGNTTAAQSLITQAIQQKPQSAFLYRILGEAYAFQSDLERAAAALERSVKLNKYDPLTSQIFSEVLVRMGQERRSKHYAQLSKDVASGLMAP